MRHLEDNKCPTGGSAATQIMSSNLDLTRSSYEWTSCSVSELNDFLRSDSGFCMFNVPESIYNSWEISFEDTFEQFSEELKLKASFPGELMLYNLKNQCQQIFGYESDICPNNLEDDCRVLWCTAEPKMYGSCASAITKWADGTPCGLREPYVR